MDKKGRQTVMFFLLQGKAAHLQWQLKKNDNKSVLFSVKLFTFKSLQFLNSNKHFAFLHIPAEILTFVLSAKLKDNQKKI